MKTLRWLAIVIVAATAFLSPVPALAQQTSCQFVLEFKTLHDLTPENVGDCIDNQAFAANGDALQHTTNGLMAWRKADNLTAFTNGDTTWINSALGLVSRFNTERYPWEADTQGHPVPALKHVGPASAYPNPSITPGATDPGVTQNNVQQSVCVPGYTDTVRPSSDYTDRLKVKQMAQYGYSDTDTSNFEEDHFVPLAVGGSPKDPKNLWPEPYAGQYGARAKDTTERYLQRQVCSGAMSLAAAQQAVEMDWVAVYQQATNRSLPAPEGTT